MKNFDDVIKRERAKAWENVIGHYGDPIRMTVVNWLVARALDYFGSEGGRNRIAKPHALIQKSIAALSVAYNEPIDTQNEKLIAKHLDRSSLAKEFPSLARTSLLDLGSGNGYLGGWLSKHEVKYTGVEASAELHKAAKRDKRLANASLVQATIRDFCKSQEYQRDTAPTLISIIGVVELLADPKEDMGLLLDFLARRKWLNVPILVATFDPDFFLPGLPIRDDEYYTAAHYGVNEKLRIRDPAVWEELFVDCGFHLLEQRPLHISSMAPALSTHLHELHERIFASNTSVSYGNTGNMARVPPRQGPFYFWLLYPRNATIGSRVETPLPMSHHVEVFEQSEVLSALGNLGSRVYRVIEGSASFESPETGRMDFGKNALFGQLETSCNYVSSRVFGMLSTAKDSQLEVINSRQVLDYLNQSKHFTNELFLSLLHHLSTVQFTPFVSAKRSDTKRMSKVLTGRGYSLQLVQNIAACLLQASANAVPGASSASYRSRILVELGGVQIGKFVYGQHVKREADKLFDILPELVQANVIDCFSAYMLEHSGAQEEFNQIEDVPEKGIGPLHIGWQAARFIHHGRLVRDAKEEDEDISGLALAISAFLGSKNDRSEFKKHWDRMNEIELHDHEQSGGRGHAKTKPMPRTKQEHRNYAVELVQCSEKEREKLSIFLDRLHVGFDYNEKSGFAKDCGLSRFMVVRDIWALLACLLDEADMWNTSKKKINLVDYVKQETQKPRIIAYIQECIAHAGRQSGLDIRPW